MIEDRLMIPGGWDLKLKPSTPKMILDRLDLTGTAPAAGYGHVVITPTWIVDPAVTAAQLLAASRYTGIYVENPYQDVFELAGPGPTAWLGDANKIGHAIVGPTTYTTKTFQYMVGQFTPFSLIAGSVEAAGGSYTNTFTQVMLIDAITDVVNFFGREFRVNPDLTLDAGSETYLYPTATTPTVVAAKDSGRDIAITGVQAVNFSVKSDLRDYTTDVLVVSTGGAGSATLTAPYKGINGNAIIRYRIVQSSVVGTGNETAAATAQLNRFRNIHQEISLNVDEYDIEAVIRPGDTIDIYDPARNLVDLTNPIVFRGETIYPIQTRVYGLKWPVKQGMGVYVIGSDSAGSNGSGASITDLTDWVEFETGNVTLEVGAPLRKSTG